MSKIIETECGNVTILAGDEVPDMIYISDDAKEKVTSILKEEKDEMFVRIGISGGGCSGFQYAFGLHDEIAEDDIIVEWNNGKVVVDSTSIQYMKGATINFMKSITSEHFSVDNPSSKSSCGCGQSFSV